MDMDNSVLIAGGEGGIKRLHGKGKCTIILLNTERVGKVLEQTFVNIFEGQKTLEKISLVKGITLLVIRNMQIKTISHPPEWL